MLFIIIILIGVNYRTLIGNKLLWNCSKKMIIIDNLDNDNHSINDDNDDDDYR